MGSGIYTVGETHPTKGDGQVQLVTGPAGTLVAAAQATGAGAVGATTARVTLASDDPAVSRLTPASTGTGTSVSDTGSSAQLLASSSTRRGFRLYNDSTQAAYVKYGTTASTTDFAVILLPGAYLEEDNYYGRVDAIWAADASGAMRITELT